MQEERTATKPVAVGSASDRVGTGVLVQGLPCATVVPSVSNRGAQKTETSKKVRKRLINSGLLLVLRQSDNAYKIAFRWE